MSNFLSITELDHEVTATVEYLKSITGNDLLNVVTIGKTGEGKSSVLNSVLWALSSATEDVSPFPTGDSTAAVTRETDHRIINSMG